MIYRSIIMQIAVVGTILSNIIYLGFNYNEMEPINTIKSSIAITLGLLYFADLYLIKQEKKIPVISYVPCIGYSIHNTTLWKL